MPHIAETVLEAAGIGGWEMDVANARLTWTAITFQIHELDPLNAPSVAEALAFYPPEALPVVQAAMQAAIDTGTRWDLETQIVTALGRYRWVRSWGLAVRENGRTIRLVGAMQDVTDRHEVNTLTEQLSVVAAQMKNIVITTDRSGRITWVNGALTLLSGHTLAEALGRKPGDLLQGPLSDTATIREMARGIAGGTGFDVDIINYTKSGLPHWMSVTCSPLREADGTVKGFISVQADISARRKAEDAAREEAAEREKAEHLLRDVLETLPIAVSVYDAEDRFVLANRAYREMFPFMAARLAVGETLEALVRLGVEHGQYGGVPSDKAGREAWIAQRLNYFRFPTGVARTMDMPDGRVMQVQERRSDNGTLVSVRTDTTELHVAEATARREAAERERAEALLRDVLDTLPSAITAYDADNRFIMANRAYSALFPIAASFAVPGRKLEEVLTLAAEAGQYADIPADAAGRSAWVAEHLAYFRAAAPRTLRLADGRFMQVREQRSATGTLVTVRSDTSDIHAATDEARREATERGRAQALLQDVLDALPNAITAYDSEEKFVLANRRFAEIFPIAARFAVPGRTYAEVVRLAAAEGQYAGLPAEPEARDAWRAEIVANFRDGITHELYLPAGRVAEIRTSLSRTGNRVTVRSDITDLKLAEARASAEAAERARADALLREVVDAVPSAIVAYDRDERMILSNPADAERAELPKAFAALGERLEDVIRLAVGYGYFLDALAAPAGPEAWIAQHMTFLRESGGEPRTLRLSNGRSVQVRTRRSGSGTLVIIRTDITDLLHAQELLQDVLEALPNVLVAYDRDERFILANQAIATMTPMLTGSLDGAIRLPDVLRMGADGGLFADMPAAPAEREAWLAEFLKFVRQGDGVPRTLRVGTGRYMQLRARRSANGNLVSVSTDITDLVGAQAMLRDVMDALPVAVIAYDRNEKLVLWNRAAVELLPESNDFALAGRTLEDLIRLNAASGAYLDAGTTEADHERWVVEKLAAYRASSGARTLRLHDGRFFSALERRSESGNLVCVRTDITDLKRAEQHLRWQAERDPLTQLHNRNFFLTALDQALAAVGRSDPLGAGPDPGQGNETGGVLLLLDIDYFKQFNDTLGHDMGDALLVETAARLRQYLRGSGEGAARLGGDEFGVVIPGLTDPAAVIARIDGLHAALSAPAELGGRRTPVGISMGATMFPADSDVSTKLLKNADLALYEAKRGGRGRWAMFRPEQAIALERHDRMADALREALSRHLFSVALQPKRRLGDGAHAGFEALARWYDGTDWVSPSEFILVAKDAGLIRPVGREIMAAAIARMREIRDQGLEPGRVAVNVTGPQLLDPHFKEQTLAALRRQGLVPADLELELAGTALFGRASERIHAVLNDLSDLGITLALDDFGTGYASLAHLSRLPINRLKIDRFFIAGIGRAGPGSVITRTVISLAHSLGMDSIAKGVETSEQLAFLSNAGCDVAQGYLISRPLLTTAEAIAYLRPPQAALKLVR